MCSHSFFSASDLPPELLQRVLSYVPDMCKLSTRARVGAVCKSWARAVKEQLEVTLSPECTDGLYQLTVGQTLRLRITLSNITALRLEDVAPRKLRLVVQISKSCPKLKSLELHIGQSLQVLFTLRGDSRAMLPEDLLILLDSPLSGLMSDLHKLDIRTPDEVLLSMAGKNPLHCGAFDCIRAGHILFLRLLADRSSYPPGRHCLDETICTCMPALEFLEVGWDSLYWASYPKRVRGMLNPTNLKSFRSASEVQCTGWSGQSHLQQSLFSDTQQPFYSMTSWITESARCAASICRLAPHLQVLKISDLYIAEGTLAHVDLIASLQSVDVACSKPLCQMHVAGCPQQDFKHMRIESYKIVLSEQMAQWIGAVQLKPDVWHVSVRLNTGRSGIDMVEVDKLK